MLPTGRMRWGAGRGGGARPGGGIGPGAAPCAGRKARRSAAPRAPRRTARAPADPARCSRLRCCAAALALGRAQAAVAGGDGGGDDERAERAAGGGQQRARLAVRSHAALRARCRATVCMSLDAWRAVCRAEQVQPACRRSTMPGGASGYRHAVGPWAPSPRPRPVARAESVCELVQTLLAARGSCCARGNRERPPPTNSLCAASLTDRICPQGQPHRRPAADSPPSAQYRGETSWHYSGECGERGAGCCRLNAMQRTVHPPPHPHPHPHPRS